MPVTAIIQKNMYWFITNLSPLYLLLPLSLLPLLALGIFLLYRRRKLARPLKFRRVRLVRIPAAAEALRDSKIFTHEIIGLLWYRVKSAISNN